MFNSEKYINQAICSIQNQNMPDVEILIIDDHSKDNSLKIIEKIQKIDRRIKVIKNKKNRGALYSKSLGILKARGKYTIILDSDDLFINEQIFYLCFNEAVKNNIDIIEFSGFWSKLGKFNLNGKLPIIPLYLRYKNHNEYVKQPELSRFLYKTLDNGKYKLIDGYLTGKCIKTNTLKKTLKVIGKSIYEQKINYGDDRLINFILFKISKSFKYIKQFGYMYNYNNVSISHLDRKDNNCHDELINIQHIYNYSKFSNDSEIVVFEIVHRFENIIKPGLNIKNWKYLYNLVKHLLRNKYISNLKKKQLLNLTSNTNSTQIIFNHMINFTE